MSTRKSFCREFAPCQARTVGLSQRPGASCGVGGEPGDDYLGDEQKRERAGHAKGGSPVDASSCLPEPEIRAKAIPKIHHEKPMVETINRTWKKRPMVSPQS